MPLVIPLVFFFILPRPDALSSLSLPTSYEDDAIGVPSTAPYTPLATDDFDTDDLSNALGSIPKRPVALSASDKWRLVKPLLPKYMFPLSSVFLSRSSISLGLPPLPTRLLALPAIVQAIVVTILATESAVGIFSEESEGLSFTLVFLMISIEGFCGGLA
ncbi:hypothetical protein PHLCEN_2v9002 [Hermanssonia centrifuga]|uniref:Uncharacterized protein n=1 Tax=Hermanssonia centrifuga TaxID=98765 RepID=A0A2R6NS97_9APHY|nr:hypothetical protein PHLCEN_2v9002 [Hermanssonia centrifuga]